MKGGRQILSLASWTLDSGGELRGTFASPSFQRAHGAKQQGGCCFPDGNDILSTKCPRYMGNMLPIAFSQYRNLSISLRTWALIKTRNTNAQILTQTS